jgi:cytochrome c peroxidase
VTLPVPAAIPAVPAGLPPLPTDHAPTAEQIALGQLLFFDPRLAADGTTACSGCHLPARGWSGDEPHSQTAAGKPNLRRAPALVNLAWQRELGWDGRGASRIEFLATHVAGQLGQPLERGLARLLGSATYQAYFARADQGGDAVTIAATALWAFVATRYAGNAPWDRYEAGDTAAVPAPAIAGYQLFNGRAQCATCHAPPLYTDLGFHRLGLIEAPDEGRGRVDAAQAGAFKTPSLRDAAQRAPQFHDGSAADLDAAIGWHLDGGRGQKADPSVIDPALVIVTLTPDERAALVAFVRALSVPVEPAAAARPALPDDVPQAR